MSRCKTNFLKGTRTQSAPLRPYPCSPTLDAKAIPFTQARASLIDRCHMHASSPGVTIGSCKPSEVNMLRGGRTLT